MEVAWNFFADHDATLPYPVPSMVTTCILFILLYFKLLQKRTEPMNQKDLFNTKAAVLERATEKIFFI